MGKTILIFRKEVKANIDAGVANSLYITITKNTKQCKIIKNHAHQLC